MLVIHNYQGLKFFDVDVAEYLARVGYVGLAIDLYGNIVPADEREFPKDASDAAAVQAFQRKCFEGLVAMDHDHELFRSAMNEWLQRGLAHDAVDGSLRARRHRLLLRRHGGDRGGARRPEPERSGLLPRPAANRRRPEPGALRRRRARR